MSSVFVSSAGSNSNAGTIGSPFLTLGHAATVIAPSGDTINLNGGNTFNENVVFPSGTSFTLQSYGTGQATVAGAGTSDTIHVLNSSNVTVSNIAITNADTSDRKSVV